MLQKKLINENSISEILRHPISSKNDLEKLAKKLEINDIKIDWLDNYKYKKNQPQIYNIGIDKNGTHWVAIYNKYYFDPLGLPIARNWLNHLQYTYIPIQNPKSGSCGLYSILFLYYAMRDDIDGFYSLF